MFEYLNRVILDGKESRVVADSFGGKQAVVTFPKGTNERAWKRALASHQARKVAVRIHRHAEIKKRTWYTLWVLSKTLTVGGEMPDGHPLEKIEGYNFDEPTPDDVLIMDAVEYEHYKNDFEKLEVGDKHV